MSNYIGRISSKLLAVFVTTSTVLSADPPNFVVYLADNYGYGSLNAYGADPGLVRTPNLNRLAAEGVRFNRGYTTASVCSPTRYGLLTRLLEITPQAGCHQFIRRIAL